MENKYIKLEKIYYKKENVEDEYKKRINNYAVLISNLKIYLSNRGKKDFQKEFNLFYTNLFEHSKLQEQIFLNSNKISKLSSKLPELAILLIFDTVLVNEIYNTNQIEGVHSTKSELYSHLKEIKEGSKNPKIEGVLKKYQDIYNEEFEETNVIENIKDFRKLYDELFKDIKENKNYQLDGELFRKSEVKIENSIGETIHTGISGEKKIKEKLTDLVEFMNNKDIPFLLKASITHFYFEYIHPFYDGNGRLGRYLFSIYLARKLDKFSALSFSYAVGSLKKEYYKSFSEVEDKKNYGDITFFVENIYKTLIYGQESIINLLEDNIEKIEHAKKIVSEIIKENSSLKEKDKVLIFIYIQDFLFNKFKKITNKELYNIMIKNGEKYHLITFNNYIKKLEKTGYLKKITSRPLSYQISDEIADKL